MTTERDESGERNRSGMSANTAVLIAAIIGMIASVVAGVESARVAANSARDTTKDQLVAAAQQRAADKRATVYQNYLDRANSFANETTSLRDQFPIKFDKSGKASQHYIDALNKWITGRSDFQGATNDLSVYGSDTAWKAHRAVANELPASLGTVPASELVKPPPAVDSVRFNAAYSGFLTVMCQEVPATPRKGCGQPE